MQTAGSRFTKGNESFAKYIYHVNHRLMKMFIIMEGIILKCVDKLQINMKVVKVHSNKGCNSAHCFCEACASIYFLIDYQ